MSTGLTQTNVAKRVNDVRKLVESQQENLLAALPAHIGERRMIRLFLSSLRENEKLLDCTVESLLTALVDAAKLGLEIDGILGHAYLVPYKSEAKLIPGYKGLLSLVRRSGEVSTISAECVHQGDTFDYRKGDEPYIHHIPNDADAKRFEKPITFVYLVVRLKDGGKQFDVWSAAQIDAHKEKYSKAWDRAEKSQYGKPPKRDSPWHTNWAEMAKKTVIRYMIGRGLLPVSVEVQRAVNVEELVESRIVRSGGLTGEARITDVSETDDQAPAEAPEAEWKTHYLTNLAGCQTPEAVQELVDGKLAVGMEQEDDDWVEARAVERLKEIRQAAQGKGKQGSLV